MRICTLLPSATEIAFALGLGDSVVAVSHECDFPPGAREKPVVVRGRINPETSTSREIDSLVQRHLSQGESLYGLDLELLQRLNPDLIITQGLCDVCAVGYNDVMAAAGALTPPARVLSLSPGSLGEVLRDIARVGNATGTSERAETLVGTLKERVERVAARVREAAPSRGWPVSSGWIHCTAPGTGCRKWWSWPAERTYWRSSTSPRPGYRWRLWRKRRRR